VRIDFPTPLLNSYKKRVSFIFRTCFGLVIFLTYLKGPRTLRKFPLKCQKIAGTVYTQPPIDSKPGSSPLERPGPDNITGQPWSDAMCPCNIASSTVPCLFHQKELDKAEVRTSRGSTGERCLRQWLTRDIV